MAVGVEVERRLVSRQRVRQPAEQPACPAFARESDAVCGLQRQRALVTEQRVDEVTERLTGVTEVGVGGNVASTPMACSMSATASA